MTSLESVPVTPVLEEASPKIVPVRRWGQWAAATVLVVFTVVLAQSVVTNPNFQWDKVFGYFLDGRILNGLATTLTLTAVAMGIGLIIGVLIAIGRRSRNIVVSGTAATYVGFFRGTPLLVQLIFWFNFAALYPTVELGVPFLEPLYVADMNQVITPLSAAIFGLGLNEGAYMSEIVRAGLLSVDPGQIDAAAALGMKRSTILRRIVLPQAMRVIIPPTGNATIAMLKTSALVSVIAVNDLLYAAQLIYSRNFEVIPLLITISIWYLVVTTILSIGQHFLEKRFKRGERQAEQSYFMVWFRGLLLRRPKTEPMPVTEVTTEGDHR